MEAKKKIVYEIMSSYSQTRGTGLYFATPELAQEYIDNYVSKPSMYFYKKKELGPVYTSMKEFERQNPSSEIDKLYLMQCKLGKNIELPFAVTLEGLGKNQTQSYSKMDLPRLRYLADSLGIAYQLEKFDGDKLLTSVEGKYLVHATVMEYKELAKIVKEIEEKQKKIDEKIASLKKEIYSDSSSETEAE